MAGSDHETEAPASDSQDENKAPFADGEKEASVLFPAKTERISDRGLTLETLDPSLSEALGRYRQWELRLTLPDGFLLVCHGRILSIKGSRYRFLFKYDELSENSRKILFALIQDNNPVREKLI